MANFKTSDYPAKTVFNDTDLYDVSTAGTVSEKMTYAQLKSDLSANLDNLYSADGTLAGNRIVTLGANDLTFSGTGQVRLGAAFTTFSQFSLNTSTEVQTASLKNTHDGAGGNISHIFARQEGDAAAGNILGFYSSNKGDTTVLCAGFFADSNPATAAKNIGFYAESVAGGTANAGIVIEDAVFNGFGLGAAGGGVNPTMPDAMIHTKGTGTGTTKNIFAESSVGTDLFLLMDDGNIEIGGNLTNVARVSINNTTEIRGLTLDTTVTSGGLDITSVYGIVSGNAGAGAILGFVSRNTGDSTGVVSSFYSDSTPTTAAKNIGFYAEDVSGGTANAGIIIQQTIFNGFGLGGGATNPTMPTAILHPKGADGATLRIETATASASGEVWTATDALGNGEWQAPEATGTAFSIGTVTATQDVDLTDGDYQYATVDKDVTFTFSNPPATGLSFGFTLELTKDATATLRALTFPASVKWDGGVPPTDPTISSQVMLLSFITRDGGTTYYGVITSLNAS